MWGVPSGRVHTLINLATFAALAGGAVYAQRAGLLGFTPAQAATFATGFFVGTFLLSPDLDLAEGQVNSKRAWGPLGFLWVPYGRMFSHRGLSHSWLVGPLTRLVYLALMVLLIVGVIRYALPGVALPSIPQPISLKVVLPILAGYYLSQWLHLIADGIRPDHRMAQPFGKKGPFRRLRAARRR